MIVDHDLITFFALSDLGLIGDYIFQVIMIWSGITFFQVIVIWLGIMKMVIGPSSGIYVYFLIFLKVVKQELEQ